MDSGTKVNIKQAAALMSRPYTIGIRMAWVRFAFVNVLTAFAIVDGFVSG